MPLPMLSVIVLLGLCIAHAELDFYEILGVDRDATQREIKKAYRTIAIRSHPDKVFTDESTEEFKKIIGAYTVLSDERKRENYDLYGSEDPQYQRDGWRISKAYNYDDIWEVGQHNWDSYVMGTNFFWLLKFYDRTPKCAELIQLWNKVGKLLKGVVRVGVVNCQRNIAICRKYKVPKELPYFLSLYRGDVNVFELTEELSLASFATFVLSRIGTPEVPVLSTERLTNRKYANQPLLVYVQSDDCPKCEVRYKEFKKATILLDGITQFAILDCDELEHSIAIDSDGTTNSKMSADICSQLGIQRIPSIVWLPTGRLKPSELYTQHPLGHNISNWVTEQLPDHIVKLHNLLTGNEGQYSTSNGFLLVVEDSNQYYHDILWHEWLKVGMLLNDKLEVAQLDCAELPYPKTACRQMGFRGYPQMLLFTSGFNMQAPTKPEPFNGDWFSGEIAQWVRPFLTHVPVKTEPDAEPTW